MPDIEVDLKIAAEYKAALNAIITLGKAMQAVEARANSMLQATKDAQENMPKPGESTGEKQKAENELLSERRTLMAELSVALKESAEAAGQVGARLDAICLTLQSMGGATRDYLAAAENLGGLAGQYNDLQTAISGAAEAVLKFTEDNKALLGADAFASVNAHLAAFKGLGSALLSASHGLHDLSELTKNFDTSEKPFLDLTRTIGGLSAEYENLAAQVERAASAAKEFMAANTVKLSDEELRRVNAQMEQRINALTKEAELLDERIRKLYAEKTIAEAMNAERQRELALQQQEQKVSKDEEIKYQDLTYEMQLAAMSKRELTAEIERLMEARKRAAAAGDEDYYRDYSEQLKLARQAMTKLRQEQQLTKIAWTQQSQAAQQLSQSVQGIVTKLTGIGEAAKEGTLNVTELISAFVNVGISIKAGLGPLGLFLLAIEGLTAAWNHYAREQAEAERKMRAREKAEAEAMWRLRNAHDEARKALREYNDEDAHRADMSRLAAQHEGINESLRERNELQAKNLRMLEAEQALQANEDELALTLERGKIMRQFWSGEIDETQRDNALDELRKREARQQQERALQSERWRVESRQEALRTAELQRQGYEGSYEAQRRRFREDFGVSAEEARNIVASNDMTRSEVEDIKAEIRAVYDQMAPLTRAQNAIAEPEKLIGDAAKEFDERAEMLVLLSEKIDALKDVQNQLEAQIRERTEALGEWTERQVRTGEYAREMAQAQERLNEAERMQITATNHATRAREEHAAALEQQALVTRQQAQRVAHVDARVEEDRRNREAQAAQRARLEREREAQREAEEARRRREERDAVYNAATAYSNALEPGETRRALRWALGEGTRQVESGRYNDATVRRLLTAMQLFQQTSSSADDKVVDMLLQQIKDLRRLKESTQRRLLDLQ